MAIAFSPKTVYEYLFSREPSAPDTHQIDKGAVAAFCDALSREIYSHASAGPQYKYVFFDLGRDAMLEFFDSERDRFLDFGSYVVFTGDCGDGQSGLIEERYGDPVVTDALRVARREARNLSTGRDGS